MLFRLLSIVLPVNYMHSYQLKDEPMMVLIIGLYAQVFLSSPIGTYYILLGVPTRDSSLGVPNPGVSPPGTGVGEATGFPPSSGS